MGIEPVAAVGAAVPSLIQRAAQTEVAKPVDFMQWIDRQLSDVDASVKVADRSVQKLIVGEAEDLHRVMIDIERARTSIELAVQVRNRLLEAYQEVVRMQI